jgi:vitamin K-dependent gamma-carboxylase
VTASLDLRPLAWCRAAIGALILLRTTPLLAPLDLWFLRDTWPLRDWPSGTWSADVGVAGLPPSAIAAFCVVRTVAALLLMLGAWTRVAGLTAGIAGYVTLFQNPFGFIFTLHLLYQAAILLALVDSAGVFALRPSSPWNPRTSYVLMRAFTASIYLWAGLFKLRPDWLDGRTLGLFHEGGVIRGLLADAMLATPLTRAIAGSGVALFEIAIGPLLLWPRTRRHALMAAYAFHALLELTARPDLLGWGMAALLLCFVAPAARAR